MSVDARKLMRLQSWLSPAFPIGAYSYSHGLERAVETEVVRDRATLVDWLDADLRHGSGRSDGIFLAESWRAVAAPRPDGVGENHAPAGLGMQLGPRPIAPATIPRAAAPNASGGFAPRDPAAAREGTAAIISADERHILAIAGLAAAMRSTSELALESGQQGIAFLGAVRKAWPHPALERIAGELRAAGITPVLPVSAGIASAVHGIALEMALPLYLHAGVANLINAAVRLIPLGQSDGQSALAAMEAAVAETAEQALAAGISDIGSAAFMIDIASMQHETQYTRLFRS
jgi:urease accessory protein